jgi:putative transposase
LERRSQKIELNPNNKQSTLFAQHCGYARVAYNAALSLFKDGLDKDQWRTFHDIKRLFNAKKYEIAPWSRGLSQNASKNAIHNFGDAVERWKSKQNRFPVFKNRSDRQSYQADNGLNTVKVCGKRIKLPKVGWIKMREELRFAGDIAKVVISRRDGRWFASILVHCDPSNYTHQSDFLAPQKPIGVDVGINTLATCSDGVKYDNPRPLKRHLRKLQRANRSISRKKFLSANWQKAKRRLARIHYRIACIRTDAHHKASTDIVRRASAIGIETLNADGMLKNRKIAKALSDSALGGFLNKIKYKAGQRGIPIEQSGMFFASSKTCSSCGDKNETLSLSDRVFECDNCGFVCDRDGNAAINLCPT